MRTCLGFRHNVVTARKKGYDQWMVVGGILAEYRCVLLVFFKSINAIASTTVLTSAATATNVKGGFSSGTVTALKKAMYTGSCSSLRPFQTG